MKITPKSPPQAIKMGVKSDSKRPFGGVGSIWRGELVFWYEKIRTQKWKVDFHRPNLGSEYYGSSHLDSNTELIMS